MSRKRGADFAIVRGQHLNDKLRQSVSNPIAKPFADTRHRCTEEMFKLGIECWNEDVFHNGKGGYQFRKWMSVRVVGDWARALGIEPDGSRDDAGDGEIVSEDFYLNERQRWILDQIRGGSRLCQRDVLAHFSRKWNASTIKRDLQGLREPAAAACGKEMSGNLGIQSQNG